MEQQALLAGMSEESIMEQQALLGGMSEESIMEQQAFMEGMSQESIMEQHTQLLLWEQRLAHQCPAQFRRRRSSRTALCR